MIAVGRVANFDAETVRLEADGIAATYGFVSAGDDVPGLLHQLDEIVHSGPQVTLYQNTVIQPPQREGGSRQRTLIDKEQATALITAGTPEQPTMVDAVVWGKSRIAELTGDIPRPANLACGQSLGVLATRRSNGRVSRLRAIILP